MPNGSIIAVKVLSQNTEGKKDFSELSVISHLRHRNLLSLTGWCHEKGKLLLVYDYMPNGNLDHHLFGESSILPWQHRFGIALGVAEGLAFLHQGWEQKIIHRDVKAPNVLLDKHFVPHLGDFGLAKLIDYDKTTNSVTLVAGTLGYMSPELFTSAKVGQKSDVYSFGVLILEIGSGKRAVDPSRNMSLVEWIWHMMQKGNLMDITDAKLYGCFDHSQMKAVLTLGLLCCQHDPQCRPSMRQCCHILKGDEPLPPLLSFAIRTTPPPPQSAVASDMNSSLDSLHGR